MEPSSTHPRGFTVIEMCLAMLVTSLVMGAMAAFAMAMAGAWRHAEQEQALTLTGAQAAARIDDAISKARILGAVRTGAMSNPVTGAAVMIWANDANGDGFIQGAEVSMIIHDTASREIWLYPSGQGDAVTPWTWATFTNAAVFENFASGRTHYAIARHVDGAVFEQMTTSDSTQRPTLRYALRIQSHDASATTRSVAQYGAATIRAPLAQPTN